MTPFKLKPRHTNCVVVQTHSVASHGDTDTLTAELVGLADDIRHQATKKRGKESDKLYACGEQDTLTDEMVGLAAQMRRNAAEMESAVKERGRLLNSAETTLDGNLDATQRAVRDSRVIRTRRATNLHCRMVCT